MNFIGVFNGHAGNTFASPPLTLEGIFLHAFDIASLGQGDNGLFLRDQILGSKFANFIFMNFGASGVIMGGFELK